MLISLGWAGPANPSPASGTRARAVREQPLTPTEDSDAALKPAGAVFILPGRSEPPTI